MNATPLGRAAILAENPKHEFPADTACITGRQHVAAYLDPLAKVPPLRDCLRTGVEVLHIGRRGCLKDDSPGDAKRGTQPFRLIVREGKADRVERLTSSSTAPAPTTGTAGSATVASGPG
jgi:hypothetical protein